MNSYQEICGRYLYRRVNHDERPMTLASNGEIVEGSAAAEKRWILSCGQLHISGDYGLIAVLEQDRREVWCGKWLKFEQMKIELIPTWKPQSSGDGLLCHVDPFIEKCDADLADDEDWIYEHLVVPPNGLFVDVGAFVGTHTIHVSKSCGCRTIAIEPVDEYAIMIEKRAEVSGVSDKIEIVQCRVGANQRRVSMELNGNGSHVASVGTFTQSVITLDDVLSVEREVDVIKIDVDGLELQVLKGLTRHRPHRPRIFVKVHSHLAGHEDDETRIIEWATANQFEHRCVKRDPDDRSCFLSLTPIDVAALQINEHRRRLRQMNR